MADESFNQISEYQAAERGRKVIQSVFAPWNPEAFSGFRSAYETACTYYHQNYRVTGYTPVRKAYSHRAPTGWRGDLVAQYGRASIHHYVGGDSIYDITEVKKTAEPFDDPVINAIFSDVILGIEDASKGGKRISRADVDEIIFQASDRHLPEDADWIRAQPMNIWERPSYIARESETVHAQLMGDFLELMGFNVIHDIPGITFRPSHMAP